MRLVPPTLAALGLTLFAPASVRATEPELDAAFAVEALESAGLSACGFVPNPLKTAYTRTCSSPIADPWPWPDGPDHPVTTVPTPVTTYETFAAGTYRIALVGGGQLWFTIGGQPAQRCMPVAGQTVCDLSVSTALSIGLEVRKPTGSPTVTVTRCAASTSACL